MFTMKIIQKSVFYPREAHILIWLGITVLYTIFKVLKNIECRLKTQRVSLGFYRQTSVYGKNGTEIHIFPHEVPILACLDIMVMYIIF
jgi:hypothetical protein